MTINNNKNNKFILLVTLGTLLFLTINFLRYYFQPKIVIVPHHNLVATTRNQFLKTVSKLRPATSRIIIIGPNHFGNNQKNITYTDADWHLSNGDLTADQKFISRLPSTFEKNNILLKNDHTVYNLLPDIKAYWPKASITPLLVGQKLDVNQLTSLIDVIQNNCPYDCLVIASVDFSHYLPASLAQIHDQKTIRALSNIDLVDIQTSEVDSPQSLYVAAALAAKDRLSYSQFAHTNSGYLSNNPDTETTTHVMAKYQKSFLPPAKKDLTTFTFLPSPFLVSNNTNTVGERFFYGVDDIKVANYLGQINQPLPSDFVVAGYYDRQKITVTYLPVNISGQKITFDRGDSKTSRIKNLFDNIQTPHSTKDYYWSTITYDIN